MLRSPIMSEKLSKRRVGGRNKKRMFTPEKQKYLKRLGKSEALNAEEYTKHATGDSNFIMESFKVAMEAGTFSALLDIFQKLPRISDDYTETLRQVMKYAIANSYHEAVGDMLDNCHQFRMSMSSENDKMLMLSCQTDDYKTVKEFISRGYRLKLNCLESRGWLRRKDGVEGVREDDLVLLRILPLMAKPSYILACYMCAAEKNVPIKRNYHVVNDLIGQGAGLKRHLSSPDHCQNHAECNDPIYRALELSTVASRAAKSMPQYRTELAAIADGCCHVAAELLKECEDEAEVMTLMGEDTAAKRYFPEGTTRARLRLALEENHKEFVGQPNCQYYLAREWYQDTGFENRSFLGRLMYVASQVVLTPIYVLTAFFLYAGRDLGEIMGVPEDKAIHSQDSKFKTWFDIYLRYCPETRFNLEVPLNKFISTLSWFMLFQAVVVVAVMKPLTPTSNSGEFHWYHVLILVYSLTALANWALEFVPTRTFRRLLNFWRLYTFIMYMLFVIALILRLVMTFDDSCEENIEDYIFICPDDYLNTRTLLNDFSTLAFSFAAILTFIRLAYYLQLHSQIGPIVIVSSKVILDIFTMVVIYAIILTAFSLGFIYSWASDIYISREDANNNINNNITSGHMLPWLNALAENDTLSSYDANFFDSYMHLISLLFWSIVDPGKQELDQYHGTNIKQYTLSTTFAIFEVLAVIVLLNMLIAIMNNTVARIEARRETYWRFSRAYIWMVYMCDGISMRLPTPFTILDLLWWAVLWPSSKLYKRYSTRKRPLNSTKLENDASIRRRKHRELMVALVKRYLKHKD